MTYLLSKNYEDKIPTVLQDPYIDGTPQVGNTLTVRWFVPGYDATDPDWSVAYQWYAEDSADVQPTNALPGAVSETYVPGIDVVGRRLYVRVAVNNAVGQAVRITAEPTDAISQSSVAPGNRPTFTVLPSVSGTPVVGATLIAGFTPANAETSVVQWYRSSTPSGGSLVATATTRTLITGDISFHYRCRVTLYNEFGSTSEYSNWIGPVEASPASGTVVDIDATWLAARTAPYILNSSGVTYRLMQDVTVPDAATPGRQAAFYIANKNITFDLNGYTIYYGESSDPNGGRAGSFAYNKCGIILYQPSTGNPGFDEIIITPSAIEPTNCVIKNGSIVSLGAGSCCHAIYCRNPWGLLIQGVSTVTDGKDSHSFHAYWGDGGAVVLDCHFRDNTSSSYERQDGPAAIRALNATIVVRNTLIEGGNAGIVCGGGSLIENNVISQSGPVTNGYGVWLYRNGNVTIQNNLIIPPNGRGVLCNSGTRHTIDDNVILSLELRNAEYGGTLNPCAFRARYGYSDLTFTNNFCLSVGGSNASDDSSLHHTAASILYLTQEDASVTTPSNINGNTGYVIYYGDILDEADDYARCLCLESHGTSGGEASTLINNNSFYSNHYFIGVDGFDGYCRTAPDVPLTENLFTWATGPQAYAAFEAAANAKLATIAAGMTEDVATAAGLRVAEVLSQIAALINSGSVGQQSSARFWYTCYTTTDSTGNYCDILDSTFGSGVSATTVGKFLSSRTGLRALRDKFTHSVQILDNGSPVANTVVSVAPVVISTGHPAGDGASSITDASGNTTLEIVRSAVVRPGGTATTSPVAQVETHIDVTAAGVGTKRVALSSLGATIDITGA